MLTWTSASAQAHVLEIQCLPLSQVHSQIPKIYTFWTWYSPSLHHSFLCLGSPWHPTANAKPSGFNTMPTALSKSCSEYHDSVGICTRQWRFLHTMLYQNRNNQLNVESHWPLPWEPTCKKFSQRCCPTLTSCNVCVLKIVFFSLSLDICLSAYKALSWAPTQAFPTKVLGQTRALTHTMPTAHCMAPKAMPQNPLPVTPNIGPCNKNN